MWSPSALAPMVHCSPTTLKLFDSGDFEEADALLIAIKLRCNPQGQN